MTTPATKAAKPAIKNETPKTESTPEVVKPDTDERIPALLAGNSIFGDFCKRYMQVFDEISEYNKAVLAEKDSEWNANKVLEKAREFARPTDKNTEPKSDIKSVLEAWEDLINQTAKARKAVLDATAKELGITLSATADRNPELEAPLKEKRKVAVEIGTQLGMISKMTQDTSAEEAINEFLEKNPLPAIGRDQVRTFGDTGASTPKYRVNIKVYKDGNVLADEAGFTKTALALTKPVFGYERGKAPKSDFLREAWEKAGNTPEKTVTNPVEFTDNDLHYVISKKA